MPSVTHNLKLNVPDFDQVPWDEDVNTNWQVLDATVGMFTAIPNLAGVWKNSTTYLFGQSVIDAEDSSIWQCVQAHISSAEPTIFSTERVMFPARWAMTTAGAQFYATQAANFAADAAASAAEAAASAGSISNVLHLTGGTMTGALILRGDPVAALEAATRQYVDARVGGIGYLPITGGTMTGSLTVGGTGIGYTNITTADRHLIAFGWDGSLYYTVDGTGGLGHLATQDYVAGNFLPLSGGSLSGTVYSAGEVQAANTFRLVAAGASFHTDTNSTQIIFDSGLWRWEYTRTGVGTGSLGFYRADGSRVFGSDSAGHFVSYSVQTASDVISYGTIYGRGGIIVWGAGDQSQLASDNSTFTDVRFQALYRWNFLWSTGTLYWRKYDNSVGLSLDLAGNLWVSGSVHGDNVLLLEARVEELLTRMDALEARDGTTTH